MVVFHRALGFLDQPSRIVRIAPRFLTLAQLHNLNHAIASWYLSGWTSLHPPPSTALLTVWHLPEIVPSPKNNCGHPPLLEIFSGTVQLLHPPPCGLARNRRSQVRCIESPLTCVSCALVIFLTAATAAGQLTVNPSPLNFGSVQLGKSASQPVFLSNTGTSNLTISQATISGTGFSLSGLSTPLTLAPNQNVSVTTIFAPQSSGSTNGSMSLMYSVQKFKVRGKGSAFAPSISTTSLSGTGTSPGQLAANPTSLNFANVPVGSNQTLPATLTNSGGSGLTISQATLSGGNFVVSGLAIPLTLGAGQTAPFSVTFAPQSAGILSGNVAFSSDGSNPILNLPLSGTGVSQGTLTPNPTSLSFGNVQVGNSSSGSEMLTNTGG